VGVPLYRGLDRSRGRAVNIVDAMRLALGDKSKGPVAKAPNRIDWKTVQSQKDALHVTVDGVSLPTTGLIQYPSGSRVAVAYKNNRPTVVIGHRNRRAQFHTSRRTSTMGVVEELLVGNFDDTTTTIWYRTQDRLEMVVDAAGAPVTAYLRGYAPQTVKWGLDGKSFAVACASNYWAVFALDRVDPNVLDSDDPGRCWFVSMGQCLQTNPALATVAWRDEASLGYKYYPIKVQQRHWPWRAIWTTFNSYYAICWAWYLDDNWDISHSWESGGTARATASTSVSETFGLQDALRGKSGYNGMGRFSGQVVDWFLDADLTVKFLLTAGWDYYVGGQVATAYAQASIPFGAGPYGMDPYTFGVYCSSGRRTIGAKKRSDGSTVAETHLFLLDGITGAVLWGTCAASPQIGMRQATTYPFMRGHYLIYSPGVPGGSPGTPSCPGDYTGSFYKEVDTESYYPGANWVNWPCGTVTKDDGNIGDDRSYLQTSTDTFQFFESSKLGCLQGPFISNAGSYEYRRGSSILLPYPWGGVFYVLYVSTTAGGGKALLWHHRVVSVSLTTRRKANGTDEPLLFLVMERYPYIAGTGYINDLPQTWVGLITTSGAVVTTLRSWQYGLSGPSTRLVSANGHRLIWVCGIGALQTTLRYYYTNLDAGTEISMNSTEVAALLATRSRMLTPDFFWERQDPQGFYLLSSLPTLEPDSMLIEYASLLAIEGAPEGSVRVVNDEETLSPVERYQSL